jgi:cytochrome oxidase Cu insertion factor (SCO1/SenC/PrrC family)
MRKNFIFIIVALNALWFSAITVSASDYNWNEETNIYEQVYDANLIMRREDTLKLCRIYSRSPVLLALIFTRCSGICKPFLQKLKSNLPPNSDSEGFTVLVVGIDPRDRPEDMLALAREFDLHDKPRWQFAVTGEIEKLNESVGFNPKWDSRTGQYEHNAWLVGINRAGFITRKLIGLRDQRTLKKMLGSIHDAFSPSYPLPNNI